MDSTQRRWLYQLIIVVATGCLVSRVVSVENVYDPSVFKSYGRAWPKETPSPWPTFASNDRARWATVKAMVEEQTFVIGKRETLPEGSTPPYRDSGILFTDGYKSVDVVLHPERQEFYSTKPPLLTVLAAGEYWFLHKFLKWKMDDQRWEVVVTILLTLNVLPLVIMWFLLARLLEEYGQTDWGRLFTLATACFGTFLPTFSLALNNHVPASCCVFFAMYALLRGQGPLSAVIAGLFSGMAVCMDLPSAAFTAVGAVLLFHRGVLTVVLYSIAALMPMAAQTVLNHEVMGTWLPVYAQFGGPWYEYPGSHWAKRHAIPPPTGSIDFVYEPKHIYAFNLLVGHHGLFSLSPVWLLALLGFVARPQGPKTGIHLMRWVPAVFLVVLGFYIWRTNNYGGWTCGPRWLFWLTPLFLLSLIPMADRLGTSRVGRWLAYLCLGVSIFSAVYSWSMPWRHPWIHQWARYMGWIDY